MRILYGILLSLIVHFTLVFVLDKAAPYFETIPKDVTEIEIITPENQENTHKPDRQIVREALAPEQELKEDDEDLARFLSQNRQRVRKETQAANSGVTKNRSAAQKEDKAKASPSESVAEAMKPKAQGYEPDNIIQRTMNERRSASPFDDAPSTMGDAVPNDVSVGSFTALNTDRYMYYSFYARIEDLIRFRWESRVRQAIDSYDRGYQLSVLGSRNWVTGIDIWLTPDGRFHSAHIMKESGVKKFDTAAAAAFREAGMFSNPPQELVEDDGFIHLKYSFNIRFQPSTLVYQQ